MLMKKVSPVITIVLSFILVILLGMVCLKLPISIHEGYNVSWVDSFFVATSAICVTGLTPIANIGATFTPFGKTILAVLIQIGGLGCISVATFLFLAVGAKLSLSNRYLLKEALNHDKINDILKLLKSIVIITISIELLGAFVSFFVFSQYYDFWSAIGISVFHSISSFNNAGFDIIGDNSLINYTDNILLNVTTMVLIILGGLGFVVIKDLIVKKFNYKKLSVHSKIVITMTLSLIIIGTIMLKLSESNISWLQAAFLSVSSRTAGFSTISCAGLTAAGVMITCMLMLIGASPSSTGGGIKTTTVYTMIKSMVSFARGKTTLVKGKKISEETKLKAFTVFFFAISVILFTSLIILLIETNNERASFVSVMFETFSAFATVGSSMSLTPYLASASKIVLCVLMFLGRLGPITIMGMWNSKWNKPNVNDVEYLEEKIIIG